MQNRDLRSCIPGACRCRPPGTGGEQTPPPAEHRRVTVRAGLSISNTRHRTKAAVTLVGMAAVAVFAVVACTSGGSSSNVDTGYAAPNQAAATQAPAAASERQAAAADEVGGGAAATGAA